LQCYKTNFRRKEGKLPTPRAVHEHGRVLTLPLLYCCCWGVLSGADTLTEGGTLPERERRFLGCIRLSLAALYQAEVVDGAFKVSKKVQWSLVLCVCVCVCVCVCGWGGVRLSLAALYQAEVVDGTFRVGESALPVTLTTSGSL
jgi:hypothetical protein